jgi:hypothetical protein
MTTKLARNIIPGLRKGLGRVRIPDPRDRGYTLSAVRSAHEFALREISHAAEDEPDQLPKERTHPWRIPEYRLDQGARPTCTAFATLQFLLAAPIMSIRPQHVKAETEDCYAWSQANDEWPGDDYDGTSVRAALQYYRKERGSIASFARATHEADMRAHLLSPLGGPLIIGVDMFENMAAIDGTGIGEPSGEWLGGHAMLCRSHAPLSPAPASHPQGLHQPRPRVCRVHLPSRCRRPHDDRAGVGLARRSDLDRHAAYRHGDSADAIHPCLKGAIMNPISIGCIVVGILIIALNAAAYPNQHDGYWFGAAAILVGIGFEWVARRKAGR